MPQVKMPDGVVVSFPDDMPAEQIRSLIASKFPEAVPQSQPAQAATDVSTVEDMARSGATGLRQGLEGTAGLFGDANVRQQELAQWAAEKLGAGEKTQSIVGAIARRLSPFPFAQSTAEIEKNITKPIAGEHYQPKTMAGEYSRTVGQFAPGIVGGEGSLAARAVNQVVLPALASETAGQMAKGTAVEPYARFAGAVVGGAIPSLAKSAISPFKIDPERQAMVDAMKREGVDLTAGQMTGSEKLRYMESELGGMAGQKAMDRQGEQFTKAILKRAGIDAERATPEVIDNAFQTIGTKFDDLSSRNVLVPDKKLASDLSSTFREYAGAIPESQQAPMVKGLLKDIASRAKQGPISGDFYQGTSSLIARRMRTTSDPELKGALQGIKEALDAAMERSIAKTNPQDLGAFRQVRREYKNLMVIEKAATGAGENAALGIISPSQLRNATVQQGRRAYARGQGDLAQLARAGEALMKPLPNSGTAARTAARNFTATVPTMLGGGIGYTAGLPGMLAGAAVGSAVPFAVGRAILSGPGKRILTNQLTQGLPAVSPLEATIRGGLLAGLGR